MSHRHNPSDILEVDISEIDRLRRAVENSDLSERHKAILLTLLEELVTLKKLNKEKMAALRRLQRVFEKKTEKAAKPTQDDSKKPPAKNHGRLGADAYPAAIRIPHAHGRFQAGDECPDCQHGTLIQQRPGKIIRLVGCTPIGAELHEPERLRCGACGKIFTAEMPVEVCEEKADATAHALIAVFRYGMGIPHFRLAAFQKAMGVPIPTSTQYEMVEMLWTKVHPVFSVLLQIAADGAVIHADDTPYRVLALMQENEVRKLAGQRTGIFTTAIVSKRDGREIRLFFTGRNHAGENLDALLDHRDEKLSPPVQVSDALSRNFPKDHPTIVALCLVHGRRNFVDCQEAFPDETEPVIRWIGEVYKNEKHIKEAGLDPHQRLAYHQTHSAPIMAQLKAYVEEKVAKKEVEPNSTLGRAYQYTLNHWEGMTRFLEIPGAPLDNNDAERLIKGTILHRKNSLFFKTENGARVGDTLMSIIQTCIANGENPVEYLSALHTHSRHVAKNPHLWLPWNYRNTIRSVGPPPANSTIEAAEIRQNQA